MELTCVKFQLICHHFYRPLSEASEGYIFTLYVCPQGGVLFHSALRPPPPSFGQKVLDKKVLDKKVLDKKVLDNKVLDKKVLDKKFWTKSFGQKSFGDKKNGDKKNGDKKIWRRKGGGRGRYASCGHAGGLSCLICNHFVGMGSVTFRSPGYSYKIVNGCFVCCQVHDRTYIPEC